MTANRSVTAAFIVATLPFSQNFSFSNTLADYVIGAGSASQTNGRWDAFTVFGGFGSVVGEREPPPERARRRGHRGLLALDRPRQPGAECDDLPVQPAAHDEHLDRHPGAVLRVGSGFTSQGRVDEADGSTFGKVGVNMVATNTYQLRNLATSVNSPNVAGDSVITWVLNKSGAAYSYPRPPAWWPPSATTRWTSGSARRSTPASTRWTRPRPARRSPTSSSSGMAALGRCCSTTSTSPRRRCTR